MEIVNQNLSRAVALGKAIPTVEEGDTFRDCNLSQQDIGTELYPEVEGLTFVDCNLVNVKLQPSWIVVNCNTAQVVIPPEPAEVPEEDAEIESAVAKVVELSYLYPEKVSKKLKALVDKDTTQGLLSADGVPVVIDAPQGWKKVD